MQVAELCVRIQHGQEALAQVLTLLSAHAIHVVAGSSYDNPDGCELLLITNDPAEAQSVLEAAGYHCKVQDVVIARLAPNRPDAVARYGMRLINAGIGILFSHLSSRNGIARFAAFKTTNNEQAVQILTQEPAALSETPAQPLGRATTALSA
jgi:hypothetical protein